MMRWRWAPIVIQRPWPRTLRPQSTTTRTTTIAGTAIAAGTGTARIMGAVASRSTRAGGRHRHWTTAMGRPWPPPTASRSSGRRPRCTDATIARKRSWAGAGGQPTSSRGATTANHPQRTRRNRRRTAKRRWSTSTSAATRRATAARWTRAVRRPRPASTSRTRWSRSQYPVPYHSRTAGARSGNAATTWAAQTRPRRSRWTMARTVQSAASDGGKSKTSTAFPMAYRWSPRRRKRSWSSRCWVWASWTVPARTYLSWSTPGPCTKWAATAATQVPSWGRRRVESLPP